MHWRGCAMWPAILQVKDRRWSTASPSCDDGGDLGKDVPKVLPHDYELVEGELLGAKNLTLKISSKQIVQVRATVSRTCTR